MKLQFTLNQLEDLDFQISPAILVVPIRSYKTSQNYLPEITLRAVHTRYKL